MNIILTHFISRLATFIFVLPVILAVMLFANMASAEIQGKTTTGFLEYYETTTGETVGVIAPVTIIEDFTMNDGTNIENDFAFAAVNSGTLTIVAGVPGQATMSTGIADDDDAELASQLIFQATGFAVVEARFKISDTDCGFNFGFSDAQGEAADNLAVEYSGTTLTSNASDFAGFFYDVDATTDNAYAVSVDSDTDGTVVNSSIAMDTKWHIYQIRLADDGDVSYWLDGNRIGGETTGISTDVPLCVYLGLIRRTAVHSDSPDIHIDYIKAWSHR